MEIVCGPYLFDIQPSIFDIRPRTPMLPKKNRISRKDFPAYKAQGFRVFSSFFTAVFYKTTQSTKVSVVVSKKTSKTAVARNALRRRFYELFAPFLNTITSPTTAVFYPKAEAQKAKFSDLKIEMEKALRQAGVLVISH